ncbi:putative pectinesterase 11 [Argentina anserina]|uniref:putative pectinesterase 11 n=1 Tax=Argentina anserina TaxID=57926 RepID=UPI00217632FD|nr:putative pectinesterase 11 [Potentilla anserina]
MAFGALVCTIFIILCATGATSQARAETKIAVDQSGKGDYSTIQEAIDSVRSNNADPVTILVKPGSYKETITVPPDKPNITLIGSTTKASDVIITWDRKGEIDTLATFHVAASNFIARYITFENTFGPGDQAQAVALRVSGDRAAFHDCSMKGYQDTLFDDNGKHYYENCYIEGVVDFIFGNATSFFQSCHIHSPYSKNGGYIASQRRGAAANSGGFVFFKGQITAEGEMKTYLGRPWGVPYSTVIFAYTYMENVIQPQGWNSSFVSEDELKKSSICGQFKCEGPGASTSDRVKWAREFSEEDIAPYLTTDNFIDGKDWLRSPPVTTSPPLSPPPQMKPSVPKPEHLPPPAPAMIPSSPPPVAVPSPSPPVPSPPPVAIPSPPSPQPVAFESPPAAANPYDPYPSTPVAPPPPEVIPYPPSPPPGIPSPPPLIWVEEAPPAPVTAAPPPPSAGREVEWSPGAPRWKNRGVVEGVNMYFTSEASSLSSSPFSSVKTMALSAAILLYLLV